MREIPLPPIPFPGTPFPRSCVAFHRSIFLSLVVFYVSSSAEGFPWSFSPLILRPPAFLLSLCPSFRKLRISVVFAEKADMVFPPPPPPENSSTCRQNPSSTPFSFLESKNVCMAERPSFPSFPPPPKTFSSPVFDPAHPQPFLLERFLSAPLWFFSPRSFPSFFFFLLTSFKHFKQSFPANLIDDLVLSCFSRCNSLGIVSVHFSPSDSLYA